MIVVKDINNNVPLCQDSWGKEVVAFDKGVGFLMPPAELPLNKIERTFYDVSNQYIYASLDFDKLINEYKIDVRTQTKVSEITDEAVIVEKDGIKTSIPAKIVILAFDYRPNNALAEELNGLCEVKVIGGSVKTSNAVDATRDGLNAALAL